MKKGKIIFEKGKIIMKKEAREMKKESRGMKKGKNVGGRNFLLRKSSCHLSGIKPSFSVKHPITLTWALGFSRVIGSAAA